MPERADSARRRRGSLHLPPSSRRQAAARSSRAPRVWIADDSCVQPHVMFFLSAINAEVVVRRDELVVVVNPDLRGSARVPQGPDRARPVVRRQIKELEAIESEVPIADVLTERRVVKDLAHGVRVWV